MLRRLIIGWLVLSVAIALTALLLPGVEIDGRVWSLLVIAIVFALVNAVLGPIVRILTLPLRLLTLGLISFVVNGFLFLVTDWLVDDLEIDGLLPAVAGAVLITIFVVVLDHVVPSGPEPAT